MGEGVSANTRQQSTDSYEEKGNLAQHESVANESDASCSFQEYLSIGKFEKQFLDAIELILVCKTKLKNASIETLQSTYECFHKDVFYGLRNNVQHKALGKMTEISKDVWLGPTDNTKNTQAVVMYV